MSDYLETTRASLLWSGVIGFETSELRPRCHAVHALTLSGPVWIVGCATFTEAEDLRRNLVNEWKKRRAEAAPI